MVTIELSYRGATFGIDVYQLAWIGRFLLGPKDRRPVVDALNNQDSLHGAPNSRRCQNIKLRFASFSWLVARSQSGKTSPCLEYIQYPPPVRGESIPMTGEFNGALPSDP